jgi:PAS domain S-box-containing protein
MDTPYLNNQLEKMQSRVGVLYEQLRDTPADARDDLLDETFTELETALEELRVADEELHEQREEVIRAQSAAEAEQRRYQELFEFAPDGYLVTDPHGMILESNQAATVLLQLPRRFVVGKPLLGFLSFEDRRLYAVQLARLQAGEMVREWETYIKVRDGNFVPVAVTAAVARDARERPIQIRWLLRDVSERRRIMTALRTTTETLRAIFEASPLAIVALDAEGRVTMWNNAAKSIFGWSEQEVLGGPPPYMLREYQEEFASIREQVFQGKFFSGIETTRLRKDGTRVQVSLSVAPLYDAEGRIVVGSVGLLDDITERKLAEQELATARRRIEEIREGERRHLARELHDVVVQQLVAASFKVAESRRTVSDSNVPESKRLEETVTVLESTQQELKETIRQLRGVIGDLRPAGLEQLGLVGALQGFVAQVRRTSGPGTPAIELDVEGDDKTLPEHLSIVLFRAAQEGIRNAIRHARATHIGLRLTFGESEATLLIRDDGQGFHVPSRLSALAHANHFGLIGLSERVASVGGELTVHSAPGEGTEITIRVPLNQSEAIDE